MTTALIPARVRGSTRPHPTAYVYTSLPEGDVLLQDVALAAFPAEARSLRSVRSFASSALGRWPLSDDTRDGAMSVLGEFTANAVVHGRSELCVLMTLSDECLTLSVRDSGEPRPGTDGTDPADDEHGRGLLMVGMLAERWSAVETASGWRCTAWLVAPDPG
ncbi:ATP-binding protein [Streptomyces lydicus]|uniref:ATP-binding protein n=1 Tax=Streptomyces lydicus TaxID=47763 RepID=UPI0036EAAE91